MSQLEEKILNIADSVTVGELATTLNLSVTQLVGELFKNGIIATINQRIDFETAEIIVSELGLDVELRRKVTSGAHFVGQQLHNPSENALARPPIVAVMGHVDHGKTTLLDAILGTHAASGEAGGITQYISAYQTIHKGHPITLLDTPGHEAFAALRQHGAVLTDVVIIVVAADDGVMPQTVEAIRFARDANAKIVIAINKIDKEGANPDKVKAQLASEHQLNPEEWGGDTVMVPISAKQNIDIDKLLDMVLLVSDLEELRADTDVPAEGLVIEAHMEKGRGSVVNLLVEQGILKPGHFVVAGSTYGKIRTLQDFKGNVLKEAGPATPVTVTGFKHVPQFGDIFVVVKSEKEARLHVEQAKLEIARSAASTNITGADILKMMTQRRDSQEMDVIVRADVQGSLTSIIDSLRLVDTGGEIDLRVISSGIGNISENDIRRASGSGAIIYGFNVTLQPAVKRLAMRDKVQVRIYRIIYELLDDARQSMEQMLAPEVVETELGELTLKGIFRIDRNSVICGGEVTKGKASAKMLARAKRKDEQLAEVEVVSVQRQKMEAKEVFEGELCGLELKTTKKLMLEVGDKLEFFTREIVKRTLS
ncbi:MAG: translation initiation factor IF-2 [Candidatus Saccharimonas sp.]